MSSSADSFSETEGSEVNLFFSESLTLMWNILLSAEE